MVQAVFAETKAEMEAEAAHQEAEKKTDGGRNVPQGSLEYGLSCLRESRNGDPEKNI